jgi:hypothetical protein
MNVVGGWTVATPFCRCNHYCVLKTVKTRINYGRQFWGCRNYKVFSDMIVVVIFCNCVIFFQLCFLNLFFFIYKFRDLNDFGPQISELEKLVDEKNLKIKECEFKLQEKDMKIGSQRKKIKKMKEEILTKKKC